MNDHEMSLKSIGKHSYEMTLEEIAVFCFLYIDKD